MREHKVKSVASLLIVPTLQVHFALIITTGQDQIAGSSEFGRQPNAPNSLGCLLVILFSSVGSGLKKIVTSVDNVKAFLFEFEEFTPFPRSRLKSGNTPVGHFESFIELLELKITPSTIDLVKHWFLGAGSGMIQIIKSPLILLESIVDFPAA